MTKMPIIPEEGMELTKEQRMEISKRLVYRTTNSDEEYRAVIMYLHEKCPEMWRGEGSKICWNYKKTKNRVNVTDKINGKTFDIAASVCYDPLTNKPVGFSGVYFTKNKEYGVYGMGIVMYVRPEYRRMGMANVFYTIQEEKYRRTNTEYGYEIQLNGNIELSEKLGYKILSKGRLKKDGTRTQVRCLIPSNTEDSIKRYEALSDLQKDWDKPLDFSFLTMDRDNYTIEELNEPWTSKGI